MRRGLTYLRKQIGAEYLCSDRAQVELLLSLNLSVDVHILQAGVSQPSAYNIGNLDLYQWFVGMPRRVTGFAAIGKYHAIEVEDEVTLSLHFLILLT